MKFQAVTAKLKTSIKNRNGFTFLIAVFIIMIIGILSAFTGKSWTVIMKREREKELIFRGSQIKEAIENWYNPKYTIPGIPPRTRVSPLMDLTDLLQDPHSLSPIRYLPHNYATELDDRNPKCAPDCAKIKVYQDPMTGKEWTVIRGTVGIGTVTATIGTQGAGIIGVASKSDDTPLKTDFKDTALENMGSVASGIAAPVAGIPPFGSTTEAPSSGTAPPPGLGGKMTKYSQWQFIADPNNDHTKLYRAYHEGW